MSLSSRTLDLNPFFSTEVGMDAHYPPAAMVAMVFTCRLKLVKSLFHKVGDFLDTIAGLFVSRFTTSHRCSCIKRFQKKICTCPHIGNVADSPS
jgi:hypothetical protein